MRTWRKSIWGMNLTVHIHLVLSFKNEWSPTFCLCMLSWCGWGSCHCLYQYNVKWCSFLLLRYHFLTKFHEHILFIPSWHRLKTYIMIKIMFLAGNETRWYHCTSQTKQAGMQFEPQKCLLWYGWF